MMRPWRKHGFIGWNNTNSDRVIVFSSWTDSWYLLCHEQHCRILVNPYSPLCYNIHSRIFIFIQYRLFQSNFLCFAKQAVKLSSASWSFLFFLFQEDSDLICFSILVLSSLQRTEFIGKDTKFTNLLQETCERYSEILKTIADLQEVSFTLWQDFCYQKRSWLKMFHR